MTDRSQDDELTSATIALIANIVGWLEKPREEVIASLGKFGLDSIPSKKSGHLISDEAAMTRISRAFFRELQQNAYNLRVSHSDAYRQFKIQISERLIYGGEVANRRNVLRCFRFALEHCVEKTGTITRYIACNISHGDEPKEIDFGIVRFIRSERALEILQEALARFPDQFAHLQAEHRWDGPPQKRIDALLGHYSAFDWTAEVLVEGFDRERSIEHSYRLAQCALDFIHLLIGAPYSDRMRLDWNLLDADRPAKFAIAADGQLMTLINYRSTSRHIADDWWDQVKNNAGEGGVDIFRTAIERGNSVVKTHDLAKRYVDALTWYGDAVREKIQASRLKFTISMELLVSAGETTSVSRRFARRGAAILFLRGYGDLLSLYEAFLRVYDARSAVAHGSSSPREFVSYDALVEAEDLSRSILLEMLSAFGSQGFDEGAVSQKKVRRFYEGIERRALLAYGKPFPEL